MIANAFAALFVCLFNATDTLDIYVAETLTTHVILKFMSSVFLLGFAVAMWQGVKREAKANRIMIWVVGLATARVLYQLIIAAYHFLAASSH